MTAYTVQKGDSLWKIAEKLFGDGRRYKELAVLNGIKKAGMIREGLQLRLPDPMPLPRARPDPAALQTNPDRSALPAASAATGQLAPAPVRRNILKERYEARLADEERGSGYGGDLASQIELKRDKRVAAENSAAIAAAREAENRTRVNAEITAKMGGPGGSPLNPDGSTAAEAANVQWSEPDADFSAEPSDLHNAISNRKRVIEELTAKLAAQATAPGENMTQGRSMADILMADPRSGMVPDQAQAPTNPFQAQASQANMPRQVDPRVIRALMGR